MLFFRWSRCCGSVFMKTTAKICAITIRSSGRLRVGCATIILTRQPPLSSSVSTQSRAPNRLNKSRLIRGLASGNATAERREQPGRPTVVGHCAGVAWYQRAAVVWLRLFVPVHAYAPPIIHCACPAILEFVQPHAQAHRILGKHRKRFANWRHIFSP